MSRQTILVSGAGIAGPTLGYWLLRRGFTPVLIERAPRFREGGYIIDFWAAGFDVAERMGLIPSLRQVGYNFNRIEFVAKDGKRRSAIGGNSFKRVLGDRFFSIHRGDLAHAIYRSIEGDIDTIFGNSIVGIRQDADCAQVTFAHGVPRAFDLVIGADGLHSVVRSVVFGPQANFESYLGYYAASFIASGYPKRNEHTYLSYAAPSRQISRYGLRDDRTAFLFVFASRHPLPAMTHDMTAQKQLLCQTFSRDPWNEWREIERRLEACEDLYFDAVSQIVLPCWSHSLEMPPIVPRSWRAKAQPSRWPAPTSWRASLNVPPEITPRPLRTMSGDFDLSWKASKNRHGRSRRASRPSLPWVFFCGIRFCGSARFRRLPTG